MSNSHLFHRLGQARRLAGLSLRSVARRTGLSIRTLQKQEETNDLSLTDLVRWKDALDVPFAELFNDSPDRMEEVTRMRAGLIQVMRSLKSLSQQPLTEQQKVFTKNMEADLRSLMPELDDIRSWPIYGDRRGPGDPARIESQMIATAIWCPEINSET